MGKHFGELAFIRGIISFKISPFEQRAFAGAISKGVPNFLSRIMDNIFKVLPPFIIGYVTYNLVEAEHGRLIRKDPADFADEELLPREDCDEPPVVIKKEEECEE